ncbi:pyridoxamine 5'-phosphate oxidase family protein [Halobacillus sp. A5]|uniref:pyridoxamine 5'-phosphate oxidase family protein n=1 Tax=Halobacillus sp. A5 TaxID=2880263 RepID=UPI0020A659B7|nr:pyridoxamine 5'-phosphate oxidase family protein [Halobacillus sp. A5]MCP3029266.1 pyridoxamine 5'-phosphate oxidase family protein [Halobacillus sp. A5]
MKKFEKPVQSLEELRHTLGTPGRLAEHKVISHLDSYCRQFIAHAPFAVVSTSDSAGHCDSSPRGDAPGFAYILDEKHLVLPERMGNKRADSLQNILENPHIGLLFMIPGLEETLRINGQAVIIKDETFMNRLESQGHVPSVGIAVYVEACFIHCAKALKRSHLWSPEKWPELSDLPAPAKMLAAHSQLNEMDENQVRKSLHKSYTKRMY